MQNIFLLLLSWLIIAPGQPFSAFDYENEEEIGRQIALSFINSDGFQPSEDQLNAAREIGINLVELSVPSQVGNLPMDRFNLLLSSELRFSTVHQIETGKTDIIRSINQQYRAMSDVYPGRIAAISLFYLPADYRESFKRAVAPIADSLTAEIGKPLYYQSAKTTARQLPGSISFKSQKTNISDAENPPFPVVYFQPGKDIPETLVALQEILNQSLQLQESLIIIPADWFFERLSRQPDLAVLFTSYLDGNEVQFPLPAAEDSLPAIHFGVVFLLIIWASFIVHYRYQPLFRGFVARYFFNHSFLVADLMENRIRNLSSGVILLIQHSFIVGLFFYTFSKMLFTETGFNALSYHFPGIMISGFEAESFFVIGIILAAISHLISIFWIYFLNKELKHVSQPVNLYCWILTLNLLVVTILVFMQLQQVSIGWTLIVGFLFLLIWFFSFNFAAIDAAKYLTKRRILNIFLTVGLHAVLLISALIFVLFIPGFYEAVELAIWLP